MTKLRRSWDKIAKHYHRRYEISTETVHYGPLCPGDDKLRLLGDIAGKTVVDLGCGCGQNAVAMAKKGAAVTGIDFSERQIDEARQLAREKQLSIDFKIGDIAYLSFISDSTFDLAISACAISFVEDANSAFEEAFRIVKPGGTYVLSDMNPLQYILDEIPGGVEFNHPYPAGPILLKWRWEFDELDSAPRFQHYVRPISYYHNALVDAGFIVARILEPESTRDTPHAGFSREIIDEYPYIAGNIPITFIIVCRRP